MSNRLNGFEAVARSLREFGYPDVTAEQISKAHEKWRTNQELDDIVEMMAARQFEDHPLIFGKQAAGEQSGDEG